MLYLLKCFKVSNKKLCSMLMRAANDFTKCKNEFPYKGKAWVLVCNCPSFVMCESNFVEMASSFKVKAIEATIHSFPVSI